MLNMLRGFTGIQGYNQSCESANDIGCMDSVPSMAMLENKTWLHVNI